MLSRSGWVGSLWWPLRWDAAQKDTSFNSGGTIPRYYLFVSFWYRKVKNNISAAGTSGKNALKSVKVPSFSIVENWHSPVF